MLDQTDERLTQWVRTHAGADVDVSLDAPGPTGTGPTGSGPHVGLYLLDLADRSPDTVRHAAPLELQLRYLVTVWAEEVALRHRVLGELAFAVLEDAELQMEREPPPLQTWTALGIPPRPCFLLRVRVRRPRRVPQTPVKLVTEPMILHTTQPSPLSGTLVGPQEQPIVGGLVSLPALGRRARTDAAGHFDLGVVPLEPRRKRIEIVAKGLRHATTIEHPTPDDEPIRIRLELSEED